MLARPDLVFALDAHLTIGDHLAGLLVHADLVGREERAAVPDQHPVGARCQAGLEIELRPTLFIQGFDLPTRLAAAPGARQEGPRTQRASASMERSRVIWRPELSKTKEDCQAGFTPTAKPDPVQASLTRQCLQLLAVTRPRTAPPATRRTRVARDLRAHFQEQFYGC